MAKAKKKAKAAESERKVRYAVIGQGYIAQVAVLPAFAHAKENSALAAIVSGDPVKRRELAKEHDVPIAVDYDAADDLFRSGEIDAVYVALPNSMHREWTVRAARAGLHVLCEKPMAVTARECEQMIRVCDEEDVRLMIAYRLHFERANHEAMAAVRSGRLGEPRFFSSTFSMQVKEGNIRLSYDLGGGSLYDLGIYCLNAARYLFGAEPVEVAGFTANGGDPRFREVDEMTSAVLRFPGDRLATFTSSFGAADSAAYTLVGTEGSVTVDPAYEYADALRLEMTVGDKTKKKKVGRRDQFAPELVYFSDCVLRGQEPEPSGDEGLADVRVIEALYASAAEGRPIRLPPFERTRRPERDQEMKKPPVKKPELVHAQEPNEE
jgi:predicted dehydrogenase